MSVLLSGLLGALSVFVLGAVRERWRNERERRGLLRLLLAEIEHNTEVIRTISERLRDEFPVADLIGHADFPALKTRTWSDVRGRVAALVPGEVLAELDGYYSPLETLLTLAGFSNMVNDSFDRTIRGMIQEGRPDRSVAATRNPYEEQTWKVIDAQYRVPEKIEEYLSRPWWGPVFISLDRRLNRRLNRRRRGGKT